MPEIGILQLKNEASEIIRAVREERVEYIITLRGQPVALLRPIAESAADADAILALAGSVFAGLDGDEIAAVDAVIQRRQDLLCHPQLHLYRTQTRLWCHGGTTRCFGRTALHPLAHV